MSSIDPDTALRSLRQRLQTLYGDRLRGLYLFGSYARGEAGPESDLDVLVVLDRIKGYGEEVRRTGGIFSALSLDSEISIVPVFSTEADWRETNSAFLTNVRREARAA